MGDQSKVGQAFSRQRPLYLNLLDDLGSLDFFAVDGDSLILDCLSSPVTDLRHGGQMLQLCYLVESFVNSLQNCLNARFCFVFFQEHKSLWHGQQNSFLLLARAILQQHLQKVLKLTVHTEFISWTSLDWLQFVQQEQPAFLLMTDLSVVSQGALSEEHISSIREVLQASAMYSLSVQLPIAFMAELRFRQDIVYGFKSTQLFNLGDLFRDLSQCRDAASSVGQHVLQQLKESRLSNSSCMDVLQNADLASWQTHRLTGMGSHYDWVSAAAMWTWAHMLQATASAATSSSGGSGFWDPSLTLLLCKAWCLHHVAKTQLPLESRCLDLEGVERLLQGGAASTQHSAPDQVAKPTTEDSCSSNRPSAKQQEAHSQSTMVAQLQSLMDQWCGVFAQLLTDAASAGEMHMADRAGLLDAMDGRLWHLMACCLVTSADTGLSADTLQSAQLLVNRICQLAGASVADISTTASHHPSALTGHQLQHPSRLAGAATDLTQPEHSICNNSLVDAFLGPQEAVNTVCEAVPAALEVTAFDDAYHWHSGKPLEPTYLGETAESQTLAMWKNASLDRMAHCYLLPPGKRARLQGIIRLCYDDKLISRVSERNERLARALELAHSWLETKLHRQNQAQATFMRNYAASMMSTAYRGPGCAVTATGTAKTGRAGSAKPQKAPKTSKADLIRQQQIAKKAEADAMKAGERWKAKQAELDKRVQLGGWDAHLQSEVDSFLQDCRQEAAPAYLAASVFKLQHSQTAWKQACHSWRQKKSTPRSFAAPAQATAQSVLPMISSEMQGAMRYAISIWMTVHDLTARGYLDAASRDKEAAREAAKLCEQAMQLLGFAQAAASVTSLLKAFVKERPARKSTGTKMPAAHAITATDDATAATASIATPAFVAAPAATANTDATAATASTAATAATASIAAASTAPPAATLSKAESATTPMLAGNVDRDANKTTSSPAGSNAISTSPFAVRMTEAHFQLRFCGDLLQRDVPAVRDPRVISFNPDLWQRKVLDAIDADASSVICAPTSSGKTFISSYCMDKVLRHSQDGIVVFVAPTKALVNQTAAQVLKDFSKGEKAVYGVFTRDYRINALEARILVTVPACLEILLFSPAHRDWVKKLRYVIFDEVHCMREGGIREGGTIQNTGAIWEHCLLLIRCPFLALSATIGNPDQVTSWLQSVKALQQQQDAQLGIQGPSSSYEVRLIQHSERYADLRYHTFNGPSSEQSPSSLGLTLPDQATAQAVFNKIHPCAVLTAHQVQHSGFPSEVSLEPCDCLELFSSMQQVHQAATQLPDHSLEAYRTAKGASVMNSFKSTAVAVPDAMLSSHAQTATSAARPEPESERQAWLAACDKSLQDLSPNVQFPGGKQISRSAVRVWEAQLKAELVSWASQHGAAGAHALDQVLQQLNDVSGWQSASADSSRSGNASDFYSMLRSLDQQGMLPMLTFSFDRRKCESLAGGLVMILEEMEARRKEAQGNDVHKLEAAAQRARKAQKASRDKKTGRKDAEDALHEDTAVHTDMLEDRVDPDFSFAGRARSMSPGELTDLIEQCTWGMDADSALVKALHRGIGVHHSGLPTKYRQVVEILFRCHYLRVVIATGTLAYGINMPCRTVAFAGDHVFLNSLQFRQMTGRAGRRGFDTLGHVIFWAVPARKCASLLISPVPKLHGNFPLSVTLTLRLLALHSAAAGDSQLQNDLLRLLQRPFYAAEDPQMQQKMHHLFQFSLQYLQRQSTLNGLGQPVQLAGMAMHLFWTEPANFAFVTLLRKGIFHQICGEVRREAAGPLPDSTARKLLLVLSHIFEPVRLAPAVHADQQVRIQESPSKVILEAMSPEAESVLAEHNQEAVDQLVAYISHYVSAHLDSLPPANVLPLSGFAYPLTTTAASKSAIGLRQQPSAACGGSVPAIGRSNGMSEAGGALYNFRRECRIASPFAALSGHAEHFRSLEEVVQCVRPGILLDAASVPSVRMTDRHGRVLPLNRYILDYWGHGQKQALTLANGLREGDAWEHIRTFVGVLRAIATAMEKMVEGTDAAADPVVHSFGMLAEAFHLKHKEFNSAMQRG